MVWDEMVWPCGCVVWQKDSVSVGVCGGVGYVYSLSFRPLEKACDQG